MFLPLELSCERLLAVRVVFFYSSAFCIPLLRMVGLQLVVRYWWHQSDNFGSTARAQCLELFVLLHLSLEISYGLPRDVNTYHTICSTSLSVWRSLKLFLLMASPTWEAMSAALSIPLHRALCPLKCFTEPTNDLLGSCLRGTFWFPLCEHFFKTAKIKKSSELMLLRRITLLSFALEDYLLSSVSPSQWSHQMKGLKWWCWCNVYLLMCTILSHSALYIHHLWFKCLFGCSIVNWLQVNLSSSTHLLSITAYPAPCCRNAEVCLSCLLARGRVQCGQVTSSASILI